jgi:hypothetical protein
MTDRCGVGFDWFGALAGVVVVALAGCDGARVRPVAVRPAGTGPIPSVVASASAAPSALPLAESVPPPPSLSAVVADTRKLSPRCEALRKSNEGAYAESTKRLGPNSACHINLQVDSLGCATTDSGVTWGYRLATASAALPKGSSNEGYNCSSKWRIELVRENRAGERTVVRGGELSWDAVHYDDETSVELRVLSDYDADGEPELLRTRYRRMHEGAPEWDKRVLTYRAGRVEEYAPSRGVPFDAVEDVDGDGLLDLKSAGPYRTISTQTDIGANALIAPPLFVHHAQRDGSFATSTPASRAYTERQCSQRQLPDFVPADTILDNATELARKLICARLWGAKAAQIEVHFKKICPITHEQREREVGARQGLDLPQPSDDAADRDPLAIHQCREWVLELARVQPPFTFTPTRP